MKGQKGDSLKELRPIRAGCFQRQAPFEEVENGAEGRDFFAL